MATFKAGRGKTETYNITSFCGAADAPAGTTGLTTYVSLVRIGRCKHGITTDFSITLQKIAVKMPGHGTGLVHVENFREEMHKLLSDNEMMNMDAKKINEICDFVEQDFAANKKVTFESNKEYIKI